jgi:catechol 2,3-dioxygenase-like lactoylglutathione lyase family enzyme
MPGFKITGTNHTSFTVGSLDRAIGMFRDGLGYALVSRTSRDPAMIQAITGVSDASVEVAYLAGHGHTVELIEYTGPADRSAVRPRPCDVGFAHIALDVRGIEAAVEHLAAHGLRPVGATVTANAGPNAGARAVYLRDVDGIAVELLEAATGRPAETR